MQSVRNPFFRADRAAVVPRLPIRSQRREDAGETVWGEKPPRTRRKLSQSRRSGKVGVPEIGLVEKKRKLNRIGGGGIQVELHGQMHSVVSNITKLEDPVAKLLPL